MDKKYFEYMAELELEPGFTLKELRKKWLELSKKYHPDKYQTKDENTIKFVEEKIIKINEAYEYLKENFEESKDNTMEHDYKKYTNDFSDGKFWSKMKEVAKKIGLKATSYALILYYVLQKKEVPLADKMLITGCLGYFILPLAIKRCMNYVDDEIKENVSNRLVSWFDIDRNYIDNLLKDI